MVGYMISAVLLLVAIVLAGKLLLQRKRLRDLAESMEDYLNGGGEPAPFSLREDAAAPVENAASELENRIAVLTERLREENARTSSLTADISHQLKTPLTSVSVMLNRLIEDENMPEDVRLELLTDVKHSSTHIIFLVQSLLTLSRLDADAIKMKVENVSVGEIFDICTEKTEILAELREVTVTHSDCREMNLLCDKKWVSEAITNIVKNCIEHSYQGGNVILSAKQNKLFTDITIKDNGCGIPENELPHIFERFYKGTNSNENSIGIGLSLAKTVIEKNRGYIKVKSEVGKGSCFCIRIFNNL